MCGSGRCGGGRRILGAIALVRVSLFLAGVVLLLLIVIDDGSIVVFIHDYRNVMEKCWGVNC